MPDPAATGGPVRTCLGCRRRDEQHRLVRVVVDGAAVQVDPRRRAPGRGAYVHADVGCVAKAVKKRAFGRALRVPVDAAAAGAVLAAHLQGATPTAS